MDTKVRDFQVAITNSKYSVAQEEKISQSIINFVVLYQILTEKFEFSGIYHNNIQIRFQHQQKRR